MNFLALCVRLRQEAGVSGTGPVDVTSQVGEYKRLVDWVAEAWLDLQQARENWKWMWEENTKPTVADTGGYTLQTSASKDMRITHIKIKLASAADSDYAPLTHQSYDDYLAGSELRGRDSGRPLKYIEHPDGTILLDPIPDAVYTLSYKGYRLPTELAADGDIPELPARYHLAIMWMALQLYAAYESDDDLLARATRKFDKMNYSMETTLLPRLAVTAEPLA